MNCQGQWKAIVMLVTINFGFATVNIFLKKVLTQGMNHLVIVAYRQIAAVILLLPVAYFWERKKRPKLTVPILCQLFVSALIGVTLAQYFLLLGLDYTSATFATGFLNMVPVITFLLALPFGFEKVNLKSVAGRAKVFGTVICIGGAVMLSLYKGTPLTHQHSQAADHMTSHSNTMNSSKKTERWTIGSIFLLVGVTTWSSWYLIEAKIGKRYPCTYTSTTILCLFGAIQSAILSLMIERKLSGWVLDDKWEFITVIYAGMVGSGLCYTGTSWCVKQKGPVFSSAFSPLSQLFVAIFDCSLLHETIYLGSVLGSILVIVGMYGLLWGKSKDREERDGEKQDQVVEQDEVSMTHPQHVIPITINSTSSEHDAAIHSSK